MTNMKWRVGKEEDPGGLWEVRSPYGFLEGLAHTYAEAIDFADREARTVEITLPRVGKETRIQSNYEGSFPLIVGTNWYGETTLQIPGCQVFALTEEERESLALDLLARRKEQA